MGNRAHAQSHRIHMVVLKLGTPNATRRHPALRSAGSLHTPVVCCSEAFRIRC